ncbi:MAG: efflux RND transporter periplasmic adaptor subunit [Candidatus Omnitrophica bacterium]|nr:efflux RND transporter periplasmic adaptor subunit [Candidatus Omnitrophota bacterium]
MNTMLSILKKCTPSMIQIAVILAFAATAFVFYNLGAVHQNEPGTADLPAAGMSNHPADLNGDGVIYTCSMHPQIKQDEPGKCPICGMELVEQKVERIENAAEHEQHEHDANEKPVGYACAMNCVPPLPEPGKCPVCGMEMQPVYDNHNGKDETNTQRTLSITEEARALADIQTSVVEKKPAKKKIRLVGQLAIDPSRRMHISADVGGRIDRLYARFDGDVVQKGQDLVLFYSPELLAVQQEFLQALRSFNGLSSSTLKSVRESSRMAVDAARERLHLAGLTKNQIDEMAQSNQAQVSVVLKAPMGGTVIQRHSEEGEYVNKGEHIVTIADLSVIWCELEAYESDLIWMEVGRPAAFTTPALPGQTFSGRIAYIDPILKPETRTVRVRVNVDNSKGLLKPGMYVTAAIQASLHGGEPQLMIPDGAPLITGERAVVYLEVPGREKPTYEGREITLGSKTQDGYIVKEGLQEGDVVVTRGAFQIDSALQIIARPSMMNPGEGSSAAGRHEQGHAAMQMENEPPQENESSVISRSFLETAAPIYLDIQQALAGDDFKQANAAWKRLYQEWKNPPEFMQAGNKAGDISALRASFHDLSILLAASLQKHGNPTSQTLHLTHCTMAFDFKGADWVQAGGEVRNPYFGSEMLMCGTFEQEFTSND